MISPRIRSVGNARPPAHRSRPVLFLLFLAFLARSASGDVGPEGTVTQGIRVTMEVPFASETLDAVRAASPGRSAWARSDRVIHSHRIPRQAGAGPFDAVPSLPPSTTSAFSAETAAPRAPILDNSFAGLENPPHGQGDAIPPDTMGAAGPNHLVSLLNSEFGVFDKRSGALLQRVELQSFWASLGTGPGQPADFPFDTKVLYDQHSGRFTAVTLGGTSSGKSWIMIAVSSSSDPTQSWDKWAIPSSPDNTVWSDYPGFGLDAFNIYVTANMFDNNDKYQYSKAWVVPKARLVSGAGTITWNEIPDPSGAGPSMQPAHTFGTPGVEYFVFEGGTNQLQLARLENITGTPTWRLLPAVTVAPYAYSSSLPGAPQAGDSRKIDTSDTRLLNAVFRNGYVWTTHTVAVNGKTEVAWYQIHPASGTVLRQGRINDPQRWFYYPSIAVNRDDVAAVGSSGSSVSEYVGGYYTVIRPASLSAEPTSLLKSGTASYYKTLGEIFNRWGDFSATVVDPSDDVTFWTLQEYAMTPDPVTLASRWGTWWGKFRPSDVAAPSGLTASTSALPQVVLNWTDNSGNEVGFKVERRRLPGEDYVPVKTLAPNVTTFTDNSSTGLIGGFTYSYRVLAFNATGGGAYSNEAFASTISPPPPSSGGGGGGCLAMASSSGTKADGSSVLYVALLLLPAAVHRLRRRLRPGKRS